MFSLYFTSWFLLWLICFFFLRLFKNKKLCHFFNFTIFLPSFSNRFGRIRTITFLGSFPFRVFRSRSGSESGSLSQTTKITFLILSCLCSRVVCRIPTFLPAWIHFWPHWEGRTTQIRIRNSGPDPRPGWQHHTPPLWSATIWAKKRQLFIHITCGYLWGAR